jgi:DNA primase catalytic core
MSLHKLTAGDGYSYLTRQVAAHDTTEKGHTGLGDYYAQKGESPGIWVGAGLAGIDGVDAGEYVSAEQMKALFGEGRHPNAKAIEDATIQAGGSKKSALESSKLGRAFAIFEGESDFQIAVARRFTTYNTDRDLKWNTPIPAEERATIRTEVGTQMFTAQFGRPPADARELSGFIARNSRQATKAVAGYDLTFSPVKSVSTLWAVAPREVSEQIEAAHNAAIADTIKYLEREVAYTREGRAGVRQVDVTGLVATAFTHRDSRAGDPDLHTHVAVSNKVQTREGRWLALDGRVVFKATVSASEHYNTRMEAELGQRLGLQFADRPDADTRKRPVREIIGVDARLNEFWSSRRVAIDKKRAELTAKFQADHNRPPTDVEALHLAQQATLETRDPKKNPRSFAEQRQTWREQAQRVLGRDGIARMVRNARTATAAPQQDVTPEWVADTAGRVLSQVSTARATWQVWHVRAEAHRQARAAGMPLADLDTAVQRVVDAALSPAASIRLGVDDPIDEPAQLRRADGSSVYTVAGSQLYTSTAVVEAERFLVDAAHRHDGRVLADRDIDIALLESTANGVTLNDLQAQMVRELATSGARVQLAIAPAGSGKTTAMRTLSRAWTSNGGSVIGLAPSAVAAAGLRAEIQTQTDTLAKLVHALDTGFKPKWVRRIDSSTLVVIDEAGMAATRDLARAVGYVLERGGSVRLVGDDQQLASIAAGGVLRDIADTAGVVTLSQLMRFKDPAEGAATLALRTGDVAGIGFYLDNDRVHVGDETTVADHAYQAWTADRAAGLDSVMLAPTRDLVSTLNVRARADRLAVSEDKTGRQITLGDGNQASVGDVIITRRNDRHLPITSTDWVKNGDRWTIQKVMRGGAVKARHHDTGRLVTLPGDYVKTDAELGYACTVHTAQGITTDTCHTVASGDEARQLFYVAMTRGRQGNHVYLVTASDGDEHNVIKPESLFPPTATDILTGILDRDQAQRSATSLAGELAAPTLLLREAASRYHDALGFAAEQVLGAEAIAALDTAAEQVHEGLTDAAAWPTLRAHLALIAVDGQDPVQALTAAAGSRELGTALDPAAVLDWRLDPSDSRLRGGPLPWLPSVPSGLAGDAIWGQYLSARAARVHEIGQLVSAEAANYTPTTAPAWAARLLDPAHQDLRIELAVWRAATGVPVNERRPAGAPQLAAAAADYQNDLGARAASVLGDPHQATAIWARVVDAVDPRISADPYWPDLADRLAALDRAGVDVPAMVTAATADRHLPDEQPAAALWWRMSRHLSPAAVTATARSGASTLRPSWTGALAEVLGDDRARWVLSDPAWPALVAAVNTAARSGWQPEAVLRTAAELAHVNIEAHVEADRGEQAGADADIASALVWRVAMLSDPEPLYDQPSVPPDPTDEQFGEPEDYDQLPPPDDLETYGDLVEEAPFDPDYDPLPPDDVAAEIAGPDPWISSESPIEVQLHNEMRAASVLRGPLEPTEEQLWAPMDEEHFWATAPVSRERLVQLNQHAADWFTTNYPGSWAAATMTERLGDDLALDPRFSPGYAPNRFTGLVDHLRRQGASDDELLAAGLAKQASTGRLIDVFRDRLMLPIYGPSGDIHGFIGRRNPNLTDTDPYAGPKYLNTRETDLFTKGAQLFGLHEGRDAVAHGATPVLVEGPLDAIAVTLATGGTHVGVAPLGTAFTDAQADQLTPFIGAGRPGVTVATDADRAGQQAAARAYWQLTARGDNPQHVLMAEGADPAQLFEVGGAQSVRDALAESQPLATSLINARLADHANTGAAGSAEDLAAAIRGAADIIGALPPEHWLDHVEQVTTRLQLSRGTVHLAVIDAGHAWTEDPRGLARTRVSEAARQPLREPATRVPAAAAPARTSATGTPATLPGTSPATAWSQLADSIDPDLTQQPEWVALAAAISRAHTAGYDVDTHLPRLAAEAPLSPPHSARDLHYRLITEVPEAATSPSEHAATGAAAATDTAASERLRRSDSTTGDTNTDTADEPEVQRPHDRWRQLADSIDPQLALSPGWGGLAATLEQAAREGFDVDTELPRLATETPLPANAPALELQYRLLAEVDIEPAPRPGPAVEPARDPRRESPPSTSRPVGRDRPSGPRR